MTQPPDPAYGPPGQPGFSYDPPYGTPPVPRRRRRLGVFLAIAAVLLVAAVIIVVVVVTLASTTTYRITAPARAGGLTRTGTPSALDPSSAGYRNIQAVVNGRARNTTAAIYQDDAKTLVVTTQWGTGDLGGPADLLSRLRAHPPQAGGGSTSSILQLKTAWKDLAATDEGPHGGQAACGDVSISLGSLSSPQSQLTYCAWQTEHTFVALSAIASPLRPVSPAQLGDIMRRMRPDLEKRA